MLVLNGTEVYDFTQGSDKRFTEVSSTIHPPNDLALMMDGTTSNMDEVHKIAATTAGGVGGSFAAASNYRYLLGRAAPVIAEATDALDANADCIFSPWVGVTWAAINGAAIAASTETEGYGSSSMLLTCGAAVDGGARLATVPVAAQPYTCSCRVRANNAGAVGENLRIDYDGTQANVTLTAEWQTLAVTDAAASGVAINADVYFTAGEAGDEVLISMWQRENKLYQTSWAYDSRTACAYYFPTASLGLVAGQDMTIVMALMVPWNGTSAVSRYFLDCLQAAGPKNRQALYFDGPSNKMQFVHWDAAGNVRYCASAALNAGTFAADTVHVVVITRSAAGVINGYLNGTAFATQNTGAGTGLETIWGTNLYIGSTTVSANQTNGSEVCSLYNRVLSLNEISLVSRMAAWHQKMKGF